MTLRRQDIIIYIVLIYFKIKSSIGYVQSDLAEVSFELSNYTDTIKLYSGLSDVNENVHNPHNIVKDFIDPEKTTFVNEDYSEVEVTYESNLTSALRTNTSRNYALINSEGKSSPEAYFKLKQVDDDGETCLLCNKGYAASSNWSIANQTSVGSSCNMTEAEYLMYLFDYSYPKKFEWILIFVHGIVFIIGLVGNALVCVAVFTNYSMRTVTNVFIVNLAVADFLVILICLPPTVVWDVTETWFLGQSMCKIVLYFQTVSITVSVLTLIFISVDRWYAIRFPLRYRTNIRRAIASVSFIWIVALLSDIPELLALQLNKLELTCNVETVLFTQCGTTWDPKTEMHFRLTQAVFLYILPLLLMMIANYNIVRILWTSDTIPGHRESRTQQYSRGYLRGNSTMANSSTMGQLRARRKAAKMLVAVVVMFATCFFPVYAFNIIRYTGILKTSDATTIFSMSSHWMCYANSAINPVIYNFMSGKFRREFRNALEKCRCGRRRVEDRSLNQSNLLSRLHNTSPSIRSNYNLTSVRDIPLTRESSRQTMQTTFVEHNGNGQNK